MENNKRYFTLVWYKNGSNFKEKVNKLETKSKRRFLTKMKLLKNQNEFYLRVSYGKGFYNDGNYKTKKEMLFALNAFCEK